MPSIGGEKMSRKVFILVGAAICTPIIINLIVSIPWPFASGSLDSWISFYGSYVGGIIGALVAFTIAKNQVETQVKLNQDQMEFARQKDNQIREYNQLPYLVKIKFILEEMKGGLKYASDLVNQRIPHPQGNGYIKLDMGMTYYTDYEIKPEAYDYLNHLVDVDLHVKLLELFNFFEKFYEAFSYDPSVDIHELQRLNEKLEGLRKRSKTKEAQLSELESKVTKLNQVIQFGAIKKEIMCKELQQKKYYEMVCELENHIAGITNTIKENNVQKAV